MVVEKGIIFQMVSISSTLIFLFYREAKQVGTISHFTEQEFQKSTAVI